MKENYSEQPNSSRAEEMQLSEKEAYWVRLLRSLDFGLKGIVEKKELPSKKIQHLNELIGSYSAEKNKLDNIDGKYVDLLLKTESALVNFCNSIEAVEKEKQLILNKNQDEQEQKINENLSMIYIGLLCTLTGKLVGMSLSVMRLGSSVSSVVKYTFSFLPEIVTILSKLKADTMPAKFTEVIGKMGVDKNSIVSLGINYDDFENNYDVATPEMKKIIFKEFAEAIEKKSKG